MLKLLLICTKYFYRNNNGLSSRREVSLEISAFKTFFDYLDYTAFEQVTLTILMTSSQIVLLNQCIVGLLDGEEVSCANIIPCTYSRNGKLIKGLTTCLVLLDQVT